MGNLEKILKNTGKGLVTGGATIIDPVGALIADADYHLNGIGPADSQRNSNTLYNNIYEKIYSDFNESQELSSGYLPRGVGNILGKVGLVGLGYALWTCVNPFAALALPIATGVYSLFKAGSKNSVKGEKINNTYQKGSFFNGFRFGWHTRTSFLAETLQPIEATLTGRGYDSSKIRGSMATHAANGARRNLRSMLGSFLGKITGDVANIVTLGILPVYKTIRDSVNSFRGVEPSKRYSPKYITSAV